MEAEACADLSTCVLLGVLPISLLYAIFVHTHTYTHVCMYI